MFNAKDCMNIIMTLIGKIVSDSITINGKIINICRGLYVGLYETYIIE